MDKFLALPIPQRILVAVIAYAFIGGAFYYLVISEQQTSIKENQKKYQNLLNEQQKLKEFDSPTFKEKLETEREQLRKKKEEYKNMLPVEDEIPKLITSIKQDADVNGLRIIKFDKGKEKINEEYYSKIPIHIEVSGSFFQVITFFKTLSSKGKRLVNVKELTLTPITLDQNEIEIVKRETKGVLRDLMDMEKLRVLTPMQEYAKKVLLFKEISGHAKVRAAFTLFAFTYTGGTK